MTNKATPAHFCQDDHQPIWHNDSEHELCPLCRANNELAVAKKQTNLLRDQLAEKDETIKILSDLVMLNNWGDLLGEPQGESHG